MNTILKGQEIVEYNACCVFDTYKTTKLVNSCLIFDLTFQNSRDTALIRAINQSRSMDEEKNFLSLLPYNGYF